MSERPANKLPITVVIPVLNEERNLPRCLTRLSDFAEVVVVDSGSSDRTREIALAAGATVRDFVWNGSYPKKRNWLLLNHPPATPWVLFLDADEIVDEAFCDEVAAQVSATDVDGFWLNYSNYFLGKKLKYGVPQRKLALIRVGKALYERIDEVRWSSLDMEVHEHPIIKGKVGEIVAPIEHNDFRGTSSFIHRHQEYAAWEAQRYLILKRSTSPNRPLTPRQAFKYSHIAKWWYAPIYFFYSYVIKLGFLDGSAGAQYAFYKYWYFVTIRLMILEISTKEGSSA